MSTKLFFLGTIAGLTLALVGCGRPSAPAPTPVAAGPRQWEHLAFEQDASQGLSNPKVAQKIIQLGNDGWELVTVEGVLEAGTTTKRIYFFKRPK